MYLPMRLRLNRLLLLIATFPLAALSAPLAIELQPVFDGRPVQLNALNYRTASQELVNFSRISLLLCDFTVETASGKRIELKDSVVFIDAAKNRLSGLIGELPEGAYRSLRFSVGPSPEQNHADPAQYAADHPLNPVLNNLLWDWQTGYIFMALEGRFQAAENPASGYVLHYANDWNRTWIDIPVDLSGSNPSVIQLTFDLAALFNLPNPITLIKDGHITHSRVNDDVAGKLKSNLSSAFLLKSIQEKKIIEPAEPLSPAYLPETFESFPFRISRTFPIPDLPKDNPLTVARVELGEYLFNDVRFSLDETLSCASCHKTEHAFTDARSLSEGVDGKIGTRNAMPLFNLAWKQNMFWDGRAPSLRDQVLQPITNHVELASDLELVISRLEADPDYPARFAEAFQPAKITAEKMALALEAYLLTLVSGDSHFDQARKGKLTLTSEEQRGMELFFTEYDPRTRQYGADCFHCHGGSLFTDHSFHNNGLAQRADLGRFEATGQESDRFKFSTPSLRNVALTAPYMHDGQFQTLEEVIDHYTSPLTPSDTLDPNLAKHPKPGLPLSSSDKKALVSFLKSLTDPQYQ